MTLSFSTLPSARAETHADILSPIFSDPSGYYNSYDTSSPRGRGRAIGGGIGSTPERNGFVESRDAARGSPTKRGRGRGGSGRGGGGGYDSPRGGKFNPKFANQNTPLSMLLRPLLVPVKFVPATQQRFLFQAEEELIQPIVEAAGMLYSNYHTQASSFNLFGDRERRAQSYSNSRPSCAYV